LSGNSVTMKTPNFQFGKMGDSLLKEFFIN
jgi:hypothetical protein